MSFDTADLARMEADGSLTDVILHEMGHVLGFGTLWSRHASHCRCRHRESDLCWRKRDA